MKKVIFINDEGAGAMVRDTLRNKRYFENYIKSEEKSIKKFKEVVKQAIEERGEEDRGVKTGYNYLFGLYINKIEALYSSGASLAKIKSLFPEVIDVAEKIWESEGNYVEMISLLSIGNMINVENKEMDRLKKLIIEDGVEDYLVDFLIHAYDPTWKIRTTSLNFGHPYTLLYDIINADSKETSLSRLKEYLENEWYHGHDDMGWYDSHKKEDEAIYSGYWSFESGVIAKILDLDDSSLKDTPYYPFDMVHYHNE